MKKNLNFFCLIILLTVAFVNMAQAQDERLKLLQIREEKASVEMKSKLAKLRLETQGKGFGISYTKVFDKPESALFGDKDDPTENNIQTRVLVNERALKLIKLDEQARVSALLKDPTLRTKIPDLAPDCNANATKFDWRTLGKVTTVKEQSCGNCWAFAAAGAFEASYLKRNNVAIDLSEQYMNDCGIADNGTDAGHCNGGLAAFALQHYVRVGSMLETALEYTGTNKACTNPIPVYKAVAWGYVNPSVDFPTRQEIKNALCKYGPLTTRMRCQSNAIFGFNGVGVYNETIATDTTGKGHAVVIVGWDDTKQAWLIKNSWGTEWADGGYGYIGYNSNRIGRHTAWIQAYSKFFTVDPELIKGLKFKQ